MHDNISPFICKKRKKELNHRYKAQQQHTEKQELNKQEEFSIFLFFTPEPSQREKGKKLKL